MPLTELPPTRVRLAQSNWWPEGAGDEFIRLLIHEPAADPPTFVAPFATVHIRASAEAVWKRRDDPTTHVSFPGHQGITKLRFGIARGSQWWTPGGWITLPAAATGGTVRIDPGEVGVVRAVPGVDGGVAVELDVAIPASQLGEGPLTIEVYAEGHPRNSPAQANRRGTWDPRVSRNRFRTMTIEGTPPETAIVGTQPNLPVPTVTGRVTDVGAGPRRVRLTIRDTHTGLLWDEVRKEWTHRWSEFDVDTAADGTWVWSFHERERVGGGLYEITATGADAAVGTRGGWGNVDPTPAVGFLAISAQDPVVTILPPVGGQVVSGTIVRGSAQDDRAIASIRITVRDLISGSWWSSRTGTWSQIPSEADVRIDQEQHDPRVESWAYTWSWTFQEPPGGSGRYELLVIARDTTSARGLAVINVRGTNDGVPPTLEIDVPAPGQHFTGYESGTGLIIRGDAFDEDSALSAVRLAVQDLGTGSWWDLATGAWVAGRPPGSAELLTPQPDGGTLFTEYRFDPDLAGAPGSGAYRLFATPVDGAGNVGQELTVDFTITHGGS